MQQDGEHPNVTSIQDACPHCARMQQLNEQLGQLADRYRRQLERLTQSQTASRAA